MQHPEQMQLLKNDPSLAPTAIEELVRFHSPLEFSTSRVAKGDFTWRGKNITKNDVILAGIAAANCDPAIFEDPDSLDTTRKKHMHIGFGNGIHFCLGAPLARLEGKIAFYIHF